jgi:AcrR family transcriptional regulator
LFDLSKPKPKPKLTAMMPELISKTEKSVHTKERILSASEQLVAKDGFDGVSLRDITAAAKVNLAAVHYHFGSKDGLIDALITRYIRPINLERLRLLDEIEAKHGEKPVPVEKVLEAFMRPLVDRLGVPGISAMLFFKMAGRCLSERGYRMPEALMHVYEQVGSRYVQALRRSLPGLPEETIYWRMHFVLGAVSHTLAHGEKVAIVSKGRASEEAPESVMRRLIAFSAAGLRAGVGESTAMDEKVATDLR